jgi:predicted nucleic acid-binding protein
VPNRLKGKNVTGSNFLFLDTSVLVEIFRNEEDSRRYNKILSAMGDEVAYISAIQLAELADWAIRNKESPQNMVTLVKESTRIVPLNEQICLDAALIKSQRRKAGNNDFGLMDGITLASARLVGQRLLTFDKDFAGEDDCLLMS